jgi:hypothetical protein
MQVNPLILMELEEKQALKGIEPFSGRILDVIIKYNSRLNLLA